LLSRLPGDARDRLASAADPVEVRAGGVLFAQGDAAEDAFIVTAGQMEVEIDGVSVRTVGAGAVLGELALLTGGARSATVRARRDSHLLRVARVDFERVVGGDPSSLRVLAATMAAQLQQAAPVASSSPRPSVISVVAAHRGADADAAGDVLVRKLQQHVRVCSPGVVGPDGLERAEREHDLVVLVAEDPGDAWWDTCVRQADLIVVVASTGEPVPAANPVRVPGADLVLVGPAASGEKVREWQSVLDAYRITQATDGLDEALRPVAARLVGRSVGIVLAGGGARAFAHLGVLMELQDAGVPVDRFAGASQGSIIAALMARGFDARTGIERAYEEFVRNNPYSDYQVPTTSLVRGRRTERALARHLGGVNIEELPHMFRCVSTDLQSRMTHVHRTGDLTSAVMASISIPALFPPRRDEDRLLVDGGVLDNLPVRTLMERDEGPVIAVNIGMGGGGTPRSASATSDRRTVRVPALGETLMRSLFISSGGATREAAQAGAIVVTPSSRGVGLLEFHQLDRMVESGRQAGRAVLDQAGHLLT
jgi:predicted acylesterase/phospholipase RssA/CRP-like cAMP-binding protein